MPGILYEESIKTTELSRWITLLTFLFHREMLESTCSEEQLQYISLVLGMVLCMGDTLPYPHFSMSFSSIKPPPPHDVK